MRTSEQVQQDIDKKLAELGTCHGSTEQALEQGIGFCNRPVSEFKEIRRGPVKTGRLESTAIPMLVVRFLCPCGREWLAIVEPDDSIFAD
jgi:hypothetical protein